MSTATFTLVERKGHWLTGCLPAFREDRLAFLAETARSAPIVKFRLGHRAVYVGSFQSSSRGLRRLCCIM